ncbi:MAG: hypothetical protein ICV59_09545 [Thermoleophilia bacterium]|nr:hypothetical protein [Thermoleophilia bacterium]
MLGAHATVALLVLAASVLAVAVGALAYARGRTAATAARHLLALVQTLLVAQVGLGLLLLSDERRATDELHYAYGTLALLAVLAPWLYAPAEPRARLAWFVVATLLAGLLAGRAYMTSG